MADTTPTRAALASEPLEWLRDAAVYLEECANSPGMAGQVRRAIDRLALAALPDAQARSTDAPRSTSEQFDEWYRANWSKYGTVSMAAQAGWMAALAIPPRTAFGGGTVIPSIRPSRRPSTAAMAAAGTSS